MRTTTPQCAKVARLLIAVLLALACGGCDSISDPATPASCQAIGAQCQLPGGPIGVCQQTDCAPGTAPPCFKCTSQH